jgi:hypothetical protein
MIQQEHYRNFIRRRYCMEYKCIPGPASLYIGKKDSYDEAVKAYSGIINKETTGGWKFHSLSQIPVTKHLGCLAACCGKTAYETIYFNMLIFSKD